MISYQYTFTNRQGQSVTFNDHTDPYNVYALQTYPRFTRNIKNTEIERVGQNNYWDFYSYNGKMTIALSGVIVASTEQGLEQMKEALAKVFAIPLQSNALQDGYVVMSWTDINGIPKQIEVKLAQDIAFDRALQRRTVMDFQIQLKANKNYITNQGGYTGLATGTRGYYEEGFLLPVILPFSTTEGYYNKLTVSPTSTGALPRIRLYGENQQIITRPKVINLTTGVGFQVDVTLANASEYVEIDTEQGTVVNNLGIDVSGFITLDSGFITLLSGANELVYLADDQAPDVTGLMPEAGTRFSVEYKEIYAS